MHNFVLPIIIGIITGLLARLLMLRITYRQFPSFPHGLIINVFISFIAALIGALAVPAILKPDFTAGVFFSIGAAQFHTMRKLERDSWRAIDKGEMVPRGAAYIEGMAAAFEARNFLVLIVSLITTTSAHIWSWQVGIVVGVLLSLALCVWKQGKSVSDAAVSSVASIRIETGTVSVNGLKICDVNDDDIPFVQENGRALIVRGVKFSSILTLSHNGQQQAILHNIALVFGALPHPRLKFEVAFYPKHEQIICLVYPIIYDECLLIKTVGETPLLEAAYRKGVKLQKN